MLMFLFFARIFNFKTAGSRPRPAPYFLSKPTKSKQKMASPAGGNVVATGGRFYNIGVDLHAVGFLRLFLLRKVMA